MVDFLFEGDAVNDVAADEHARPGKALSIPQLWLEEKPDTVLAILASTRWQQNQDNELIVSRPLDSLADSWSPEITDMILEAYDPDATHLDLVPGVEFAEAVEVLSFYGLFGDEDITNGKIRYHGRNLHLMVVMRASAFVANSKFAQEFVDGIIAACRPNTGAAARHVALHSRFLFCNHSHSFDNIREANAGHFVPWHRFCRSGKDDGKAWVDEKVFREKVLTVVQEVGFGAAFGRSSIVVSSPRIENEYDDREKRSEGLWHLELSVPEAQPPKKRPREGNR
jgi:hypothetical protein